MTTQTSPSLTDQRAGALAGQMEVRGAHRAGEAGRRKSAFVQGMMEQASERKTVPAIGRGDSEDEQAGSVYTRGPLVHQLLLSGRRSSRAWRDRRRPSG